MLKNTAYPLILFLFVVRAGFGQIPGSALFEGSIIHEIKITSLYNGLADSLTDNYVSSFGIGQFQTRKVPYTFALVTIDGTALDTIGVRYKGYNSWWSSVKKPIKIDFNKYKDQTYDGLTKINLHNGAGDPSFIRENISYNILRSMGIKAPRTAYAKVFIDDTYLGLYRLVEQIDNTFLDVNFGEHSGNLYVQQISGSGGYGLEWISNNQEDYYENLELENHQKDNDWSSLIHFIDVLNNTPDGDFKEEIEKLFDVEEYLQILAFDVAINNYDWYGAGGRNYYLVEVDGKFHWLPWDYNLSWREDAKPIDINGNDYPILIRRLLNIPVFYEHFLEYYCSILPELSSDNFNTLVDNEVEAIKPIIEFDPFLDYPFEAFETNSETTWNRIPGLKEFAAQRFTEITSTLESQKLNCSIINELPSEIESSFVVFPVPANDVLFIESFQKKVTEISIINGLGQVVLHASVNESGSIDVSQLKTGCYILKANVGSKVYSRLFLVE